MKMRFLTKFPALIESTTGVLVQRVGRTFTFLLDWLSVAVVDSIADPTSRFILVVSGTGTADQLYERIALDDFQASVAGLVQVITAGGTQNIDAATSVVIVNQTVGAAITLNLPAAAGKVGPVKVVDWKGDAGTNNITIAPNGAETFNGAAATWVIGNNSASSVFSPYAGHGYAV